MSLLSLILALLASLLAPPPTTQGDDNMNIKQALGAAIVATAVVSTASIATAPQAEAATGGSYRSYVVRLANNYGCSGSDITIRSIGGHQGATDVRTGKMYIKPGLSKYRLRYVVAHECAHNKQARAYGGNVSLLKQRMNAIYGGSGFQGLERNADCATVVLGLSGQHYSRNCGGAKGRAAWNTIRVARS